MQKTNVLSDKFINVLKVIMNLLFLTNIVNELIKLVSMTLSLLLIFRED